MIKAFYIIIFAIAFNCIVFTAVKEYVGCKENTFIDDRLLESIREERREILNRPIHNTGTGELTILSSEESVKPRVIERNYGSNSQWDNNSLNNTGTGELTIRNLR